MPQKQNPAFFTMKENGTGTITVPREGQDDFLIQDIPSTEKAYEVVTMLVMCGNINGQEARDLFSAIDDSALEKIATDHEAEAELERVLSNMVKRRSA